MAPSTWTIYTPIAPVGTKVIIHERPKDRKSWDPHGKEGLYTGPALDYYRCYKIFVLATRAERITDTVAWFPKQCIMPGGSALELFTEATKDLSMSIKNLTNTIPESAHNKNTMHLLANTLASTLRQYHDMFHQSIEGAEQRVKTSQGTQNDLIDSEEILTEDTKQDSGLEPTLNSDEQQNSPEDENWTLIQKKKSKRIKKPITFADGTKHSAHKCNQASTTEPNKKPSNFKTALESEDRLLWEQANYEEFARLHE